MAAEARKFTFSGYYGFKLLAFDLASIPSFVKRFIAYVSSFYQDEQQRLTGLARVAV
jgi:hypothetical protein